MKHRAQRAKKAGRPYTPGTITLTPDQALTATESLATINVLQIAITDRLTLAGQQPRGDTAALFRALAQLRAAIQPALDTAEEERIERARPRNWQEAQARAESDLEGHQ